MSAETNRSAGTVRCDGCGDSSTVGRYCEYNETMTHRRVRWLCADCHPSG